MPMNTGPRNIFMFVTFWIVASDFVASFFMGGMFAMTNTFPAFAQYVSWTGSWTQAVDMTGGVLTGIWAGFNPVMAIVRAPIAAFSFLGSLFAWILNVIAWFFTLVNFPFQFVPSPFNTIFEILFWAMTGISIMMGIRILGSGAEPA